MRTLFIIFILMTGMKNYAQNLSGVINTYIKVDNVDLTESKLKLDNVDSIAVHDSVLIIQMQGAEILTTAVDSVNGLVSEYNGAGNWEFAEVCAIDGKWVTFKKKFKNIYSEDGFVQVIKLADYQNPTITSTLTCQPWDGETGGVLVLFASGTVTLNAVVDVSQNGFRGGQHEESTYSCSFLIPIEDYEYTTNSGRGGKKGEGVAIATNNDCGKGPLGNGGGGGNDHNSGGGGGANIASGGNGGENQDPGNFTCKGYFPGIGGRLLSNANGQLYLGGGGGAGHSNSTLDDGGGNGGGIVIIVADEIVSNGNKILSNAGDGLLGFGDGAGAGGAGGSVFLHVNNYVDTVRIEANGGVGGNADGFISPRCFGPGGGGAGGAVWIKDTIANGMVTASLDGGIHGVVVNTTSPCAGEAQNATYGGTGQIYYGAEVIEGYKCNNYCGLVMNVDLGDNVNTCDVDTLILDAGNPGSNFMWNTGDTTQIIGVFGQGSYLVMIDDGYCIACDSVDVQNYADPELTNQNNFTICGTSAVLDCGNLGATYAWATGDTTQTITVSEGGEYSVNVSNGNCDRWFLFTVIECFDAPNLITPNGDGQNDFWIVPNLEFYPGNNVKIYNRNGQKVFEATEYQNDWDASGLAAGVYYYQFDLNSGEEPKTGTITILRQE